MLDPIINPRIETLLAPVVKKIIAQGMSPTQLSIAAAGLGVLAAFAAGMQGFTLALVLIILFRGAEILARMVGEESGRTQTAIYLDMIVGPCISCLIIFLFGVGIEHSAAASFMIFCLLILVLATYIPKVMQVTGDSSTSDGFSLDTIIGKSEVTVYLLVCCIFSIAFSAISMMFGLVCLACAYGKALKTLTSFKTGSVDHEDNNLG